MKLIIFLLISTFLFAQDTDEIENIHQMRETLLKQKKENENLIKLLNAYQQKFQTCDTQLTLTQTLK